MRSTRSWAPPLLAGDLPLKDRVLLVSGRVSFEIVQKAAVAGIPIVARDLRSQRPGGRRRAPAVDDPDRVLAR